MGVALLSLVWGLGTCLCMDVSEGQAPGTCMRTMLQLRRSVGSKMLPRMKAAASQNMEAGVEMSSIPTQCGELGGDITETLDEAWNAARAKAEGSLTEEII